MAQKSTNQGGCLAALRQFKVITAVVPEARRRWREAFEATRTTPVVGSILLARSAPVPMT